MSASLQPIKVREPRPAPPPAANPAPPAPAPESVYWGDRVLFLFWISCFVLMVLMNVYDTIVGLFTR